MPHVLRHTSHVTRHTSIKLYRDADAQLAADEAYLKLNGNAQYFHEAPSGNSLAVYREQLVRLRLVGLSHDFSSLYGTPVPEDDGTARIERI